MIGKLLSWCWPSSKLLLRTGLRRQVCISPHLARFLPKLPSFLNLLLYKVASELNPVLARPGNSHKKKPADVLAALRLRKRRELSQLKPCKDAK